jgi:hypothetical protein
MSLLASVNWHGCPAVQIGAVNAALGALFCACTL